jgi:hypothetical protein
VSGIDAAGRPAGIAAWIHCAARTVFRLRMIAIAVIGRARSTHCHGENQNQKGSSRQRRDSCDGAHDC